MRNVLLIATAAVSLAGAAPAAMSASHAQAQARQSRIAPNEQRALANTRAEAARARERAAQLDRQAQASTQASERATIDAAVLAARVQQAEAALAGAEAALGMVRQQRIALDARLAEQQAPVARLVSGLQSLVRRPTLLALARPGSIRDAVHLRAVVAAVEPQIRARTSTLRAELARAGELERKARSIAARRQALQARLASQRSRLATLAAAEILKARRAAGAADREAERAFALGEQARDPSALARRLQTETRADRSGRPPSIDMRSPGPVRKNAALTSYRLPIAGARVDSADGGAMLLARPRALVVAPAAGRIAFAGPFRGYGTIVIVEHAEGWTSLITGLGSAQVTIGQDVIGGSPLGQSPPRVSWIKLELRRNDARVNPLDQMR